MSATISTPGRTSRLVAALPFLQWARFVNGRTLRADLLAGLTGAIVVLPQGVAFAVIAGLPPQYGLYASIVPTIVAALFGSSWHLVAGPSTTAEIDAVAQLRQPIPVHGETIGYLEMGPAADSPALTGLQNCRL